MAIDRRLRYLSLSQASWVAVAAIDGEESPLSQGELAHRFGVEGATVVTIVDRPVKIGLLLRIPTLDGRRKKLLVITDEGNALYEKVRTEADALARGSLRMSMTRICRWPCACSKGLQYDRNADLIGDGGTPRAVRVKRTA